VTGPTSYAIILTHNRPELLARCVAAVAPQVDTIILVDNESDPPALIEPDKPDYARLVLLRYSGPPNLSAMWNLGLTVAAACAQAAADQQHWDAIMLCDDAILPDRWVRNVSTGMREHGAAAACTHPLREIHSPILKLDPDRDITNRMCGWAYMLAGEKGLRADQRLRWWWGDTHMDWLARKAGGMVILPGPVVANERPNDFTVNRPELGEQAGRDGKTFAEIWGWRPW
jgi:glycosyltransferase involved in cell wall biosynthesis